MVFSSIEFILYFLPVFLIIYGISPKKYKNITLLAGSLIFYAAGELKYLWLLVVSVFVNYVISLYLRKGKIKKIPVNEKEYKNVRIYVRRKWLILMAIIGNLAVLLWFKKGTELPLGISFYTFQILSYLLDVYWGKIAKQRSFLNFAVFITMFPRIASGPIVNYSEVEQELHKRPFLPENIQEGAKLFIAGLVYKVLLADYIGLLWNEVQVIGFESISAPLAWLGALAYSMNIYFDFYGYSLMARGIGKMLGFHLPENFNMPYMARGVRDFYRRWHVTLGRWFCNYLYIPLGGSRREELRTIQNLMVVWLATALWHGMMPNFFIWGGLLCCCIIIERQFARRNIGKSFRVLPHIYLWVVIPITWMCFAITDIEQLQIYLFRMFGIGNVVNGRNRDWIEALKNYGYLFLISFIACTPLLKKFYLKWKDTLLGVLVLAGLFWICIWRLQTAGNNPFLYLKF